MEWQSNETFNGLMQNYDGKEKTKRAVQRRPCKPIITQTLMEVLLCGKSLHYLHNEHHLKIVLALFPLFKYRFCTICNIDENFICTVCTRRWSSSSTGVNWGCTLMHDFIFIQIKNLDANTDINIESLDANTYYFAFHQKAGCEYMDQICSIRLLNPT